MGLDDPGELWHIGATDKRGHRIAMTNLTRAVFALALAMFGFGAIGGVARAQGPDAYLDDRSNAASVILSLYNAINRHEYARAWSYWGEGPERPDYEPFRDGYRLTEEVFVAVGPAFSEGAAGSVYYTLPVAIEAHETGGAVRVFAGCYLLRLGQPAIQEPPFRPLHILRGKLVETALPLADAVPDTCPN